MRRLAAAMGLAGLLALAGPAGAAIVDVTYTGLASGFDNGVFGSNQSYVNTGFVAHYQFDETNTIPGFGSLLAADVTINGVDFNFLTQPAVPFLIGTGDGAIEGYTRTSSVQLWARPPGNTDYLFIRSSNAISSGLVPEYRTDAFGASGPNTGSLAGVFNTLYIETSTTRASFGFSQQSVLVTSAPSTPLTGRGVGFAAVPEPSTWLLMLTGFGLVGAALRRRRGNMGRFAVA